MVEANGLNGAGRQHGQENESIQLKWQCLDDQERGDSFDIQHEFKASIVFCRAAECLLSADSLSVDYSQLLYCRVQLACYFFQFSPPLTWVLDIVVPQKQSARWKGRQHTTLHPSSNHPNKFRGPAQCTPHQKRETHLFPSSYYRFASSLFHYYYYVITTIIIRYFPSHHRYMSC